MKIGESTNSVVATLTREELFKSMGSLSTSISTHVWGCAFFKTAKKGVFLKRKKGPKRDKKGCF